MDNPFVIFGYMVWFAVTAVVWIIGLSASVVGVSDEDGIMFGIGVLSVLAAMLSTSFFLAGL